MDDKKTVGFAITGSFCTHNKILDVLKDISKKYKVIPILSENTSGTDTRFGKADDFIKEVERICNNKSVKTINEAEPIGPKKLLDVLVIAPCTGNTIAKIAGGIADTTVTLAAKSHLRNNRPIVVAVSTNDGLGGNAENIGKLLVRKNIFLVPFKQDDCIEKENSVIADFKLIDATIEAAFKRKQIQPILCK